MRRGLVIFASLACLLALCVLAQSQQPPQTPPPPTPPPATPPPPPSTPTTSTGTSTVSSPTGAEPRRQVYMIGCVQMDDGSPPPKEVRVRIVCAAGGSGVVSLDTRGCYSVVVGETGARGTPDTFSRAASCDVRPEAPGYRVGGVIKGRNVSAFGDVIDMGTMVLTSAEGGSTVSLNSLSAPERARKAFMKADKELRGKAPDDRKALRELQKAVAEYPTYASAWQLIGEIRDRQKDEPAAREAFQKAISADSNYVTPYLSLANIELRTAHWAELAKLSESIIRLTPDSVEGQYFQAVSNYGLRNLEVAEKAARSVVEKKQADKYPSVHLILGDVLSQRGEIAPAAVHFRTFLSLRPEGQNAQMVRDRLQAWEQAGVLAKP